MPTKTQSKYRSPAVVRIATKLLDLLSKTTQVDDHFDSAAMGNGYVYTPAKHESRISIDLIKQRQIRIDQLQLTGPTA